MLDLVLTAVVAMLARNYIELSVLFGSAVEYISALGPQTDKTNWSILLVLSVNRILGLCSLREAKKMSVVCVRYTDLLDTPDE